MITNAAEAERLGYPAVWPLRSYSSGCYEDGGSLLLRRVVYPDTPQSSGTPGVLYYRPSPSSVWTKVTNTFERPEGTYQGVKGRIPAGDYPLVLHYSEKQAPHTWTEDPRRPLLLNVPGRKGIQIHAGTKLGHTSGCILVGPLNPNLVGIRSMTESQAAFNRVRDLWGDKKDTTNPQFIRIEEVIVTR